MRPAQIEVGCTYRGHTEPTRFVRSIVDDASLKSGRRVHYRPHYRSTRAERRPTRQRSCCLKLFASWATELVIGKPDPPMGMDPY